MSRLIVEAPAKLEPLLHPSRYKAIHGGRGGAKSHFFAEQIILSCYRKKTRAACIREVQASIKDSVRQLLIDKIQKFGLGQFFTVLDSEIRGRNGSLIIFKGMQSYNAENIKSLEGFDLAWVEEAQTLSEKSLRLLRPTMRKEGSEIWFSWNPRHDTDAVDQFFRGKVPPPGAIVVEVNSEDNPWLPAPLKEERAHDYSSDPEMAEHVWGGGYETITEASYYARLVIAAEKEGRIGHFPHDWRLPVITGWDLGIDDYTAIWFAQIIGDNRLRIIDYYECQNLGAKEIFADALPEFSDELECNAKMQEIGREVGYDYGPFFFPHDIAVREWGAGGKSRSESIMKLGVPLHLIRKGTQAGPEDRVQAVRNTLPVTEFNATNRVLKGITRLRRYRRKFNELMGTYQGPLKDGNDHGADAFGELAVNVNIKAPAKPAPPPAPVGWTPQQFRPQTPKGRIKI